MQLQQRQVLFVLFSLFAHDLEPREIREGPYGHKESGGQLAQAALLVGAAGQSTPHAHGQHELVVGLGLAALADVLKGDIHSGGCPELRDNVQKEVGVGVDNLVFHLARPFKGDALDGDDLVVDGAISRPLLSTKVVGKPGALKLLESIVHPLVHAEKRRAIAAVAAQGGRLVVLDIPLLFETGSEAQCDAVAVVSAPAALQRERVLAREGMTEEKLEAILTRQMPDEEKRRRAEFVIDTSVVLEETKGHVDALIGALRGRPGKACQALLLQNE